MNPDFWNERFGENEPVYGTDPNVFLASQVDRFRAGGNVLCLGEGEGRNAVWLAEKGMNVEALDYASVAIERTRALARQRGVKVETIHADLSEHQLPSGGYDAVVAVFLHLPGPVRKQVHRQALDALRPGGVFVAEYFSKEQLAFGTGGPKNPAMLYSVEDLRVDFATDAARIERLEQVETELEEGRYHRGRASVIRVVVSRVA